jgi:hypothetical protein
MRKLAFCVLAVLVIMSAAVSAIADTPTGPEPEYEWTNFDSLTIRHDEPAEQSAPHKGWWMATLSNKTGVDWASVTITTGANDKVAIVKGEDLRDEFGFTADSISVSRPGTAQYFDFIETRYYTDFDGTGELYKKVVYTFSSAVPTNQKVSFKVYTDNSYYTGPYADYFNLVITPTAVPEPSSLAALLGGVAGLAGFIRRRK